MPSKKEPEDPVALTEAVNSSVLTEMVNNLEATKLKLLLEIKELKEKLDQQKEDQSDIYYYLNKKCDESFEVIASLEEQILNEQADREIAEKLYETKIEELKTSSTSNEAKLNAKITDLENRLEMLNTFSETKDETEKNLKDLMTKLEEERIQFSINAENMENKFLMEREKLRKSYDVKYENIKKELEQSVDGKLTKKTKKTQIMNIIMKKELDSQSKHAEKLLEINQNIMTKDRELKLELELSNSLQNEMTNKLAMYQRMIKQVNEKVSSQETQIESIQHEYQEKLSKKTEENIHLEAKINHMHKKISKENSKMDEMWKFLSTSYQVIKNKNEAVQHKDHELLLVELIREVALKHPKALGPLLSSHALQPGGSSFEGDGLEIASSMSSVVGTHKEYSSFGTGIPSWDQKSDLQKSSKTSRTNNSRQTRSIAVQTDGKVSPYPQGSVWLDSSMSTVSKSLVGSGLNQPRSGVLMRPSLDDHSLDRSLDMHSMPHMMWGGGVDGGSIALTSSTSDVENYTIKSANYAIQMPSKAATTKTKALAKLRKNDQKFGNNGLVSNFRDLDQIILDSTKVQKSKHLAIIPRAPVDMPLNYFDSATKPYGSISGDPLLTKSFNGSLRQQGGIAVSGQGFAPPLLLPKL